MQDNPNFLTENNTVIENLQENFKKAITTIRTQEDNILKLRKKIKELNEYGVFIPNEKLGMTPEDLKNYVLRKKEGKNNE